MRASPCPFILELNAYDGGVSSQVLPEEYEVYSTVLTQRSSPSGRERFVIGETVRAREVEIKDEARSKMIQWMVKLPGLKEATIEQFFQGNRAPAVLERQFNLPLPYVLLSDAECGELWDGKDKRKGRGGELDGWKVFHERYPRSGGVVRFSRVGFADDETQALLEIGVTADWLMGHGAMILLKNEPEAGWRIVKELRTWIS